MGEHQRMLFASAAADRMVRLSQVDIELFETAEVQLARSYELLCRVPSPTMIGPTTSTRSATKRGTRR